MAYRCNPYLARRVGFQNSASVSDQRFQTAGSYSLMSPPRTGRRRILPWAGWGTGSPGRGGRQLEGAMRSLRVVVGDVVGQHAAEVSLAEDQHAVGEFGANGQY